MMATEPAGSGFCLNLLLCNQFANGNHSFATSRLSDMPQFRFPLSPDGMELTLLIGLNEPDRKHRAQAGKPIPQPIQLRALIDSGCSRSAVTPHVFPQLELVPFIFGTTQTAGGSFQVDLYRVDMIICGPAGEPTPPLVVSDLLVSALSTTLPFDVLIGMDVLRECLLVLDGPGQQFILGF
jgi:hypothetical protein